MALDPTTGTSAKPPTAAQRKRGRAALRRREAERRRDAARQSEAKDKRDIRRDTTVRAAADQTRVLPGHMTADPKVTQKLRKAGVTPNLGDGGIIGKIGSNWAEAAVNTPAGLFEVGKAGTLDLRDTARGKPTLKRSRRVGEAVVASTVATVRHPLRRPGDTLLLGWGAVGAGAGAASRLGAAGRHVRKGNVGKALVGKPHEGGSLLRAPQPRERVLRHGDLEVRAPESRNKAVAAVTRHLDKRSGGQASPRRVGQELSEELRITEALERAPMLELAQKAKRLTRPQETAIRVVAEGKPIAARIAAHERDMKTAKTPQARRDLRQKILLLKAAERYVDDATGRPEFRDDFKGRRFGKGVGPDDLRAVYERAGVEAGRREDTLRRVGALDEAQIESRRHAPGRVIAGARMETQREATKARGRTAKKARVEQFRDYPGRSKTVTRERTEAEAKQRLADVESEYERVMRPLVDKILPPAIRQAEQARRNRLGSSRLPGKDRLGRTSGAVSKKSPTRAPVNSRVIDDAYQQAEARVAELAAKPDAHPVLQRVAALIDERDQLRATLADQTFAPPALGAFGSVTETIPGKPRRVHMREQRAEKAIRATPRLTGAEDFTGGQFRVPYTPSQAPRAHEGSPMFRGGVPRKPASTTKAYTGGLLRTGNFRDDAARQIAESGVEAQRYAGALRLRDRLLQGAKDEPFDNAVPIKTDDLANKPYPPEVARILAKAEDGATLTRAEKKYLGGQFDEIVRELGLDPDRPITAVKGVKWIDRTLLEELHRQGAPLRALIGNRSTDVVDAINNFSRLAIFYTKPGYIPPNVIGNALLNFNQQGFSSIPNLAATGSWARKLGDDVAKVDAVMGEGVIGSLGGGNKGAPLAGAANTAAGKLGLITDRRFRRNAFRHEARQAGFRTAAQVKDLLTNPARRGDLVEIAKRANREVIDYGRLSKKETEIVRRLLFVYPFLKGSAIYTGRFVKEHPVKAAAMAQLAQVGKEEADRELGPRPSYAEGLVSLGDGRAMNLAGAGLFNAPAQVGQTIGDFATGRYRSAFRLSEMLTPAASLGLTALTRRDSFTGRTLKSPGDIVRSGLVDSLPQKQLYDRLTRPEGGDDNRVYPYSDRDALLQFGLGSIAPRPVNREALNKEAREEQASDLSPIAREFRKVFDDRRQTHEAFKKHGLKLEDGRLPKSLRRAFNVKAERYAGYARVGHEPTQLDRYLSDMRVFVKLGVATPEQAAEGVRWAKGATSADIEALRNTWSTKREGAWRKLYLDNFAFAREAIEDSGGDASFLRQ